MEIYLESIKTAFLIFPFLAFLVTIPYLLFEYHKYGSVPLIRSSIVYTFILYLLTAYFLVILPLPSKEEVLAMPSKVPQLIPFSFINDFITSLKENQGLSFFTSPIVYTTLFNIAITMPFGIYLRYYFKKKWYQVIIDTFLLSLFFEITQLTGLYGIYDKAYRLFDVDDLIINTLGGVLGYIITPIVTIFLPNRDKIDELSYKNGKNVSIYRRCLAFIIDIFVFATLLFIIITITSFNNTFIIFIITIFIYYIIIPTITKKTVGKYIVKIKLTSSNKYETISIFLRQILLYYIFIFGPIIVIHLNLLTNILGVFYLIIIITFYLKAFLRFIGLKKEFFYEKITKTKNISTITYKNESSQSDKNMINYNKEEVEETNENRD